MTANMPDLVWILWRMLGSGLCGLVLQLDEHFVVPIVGVRVIHRAVISSIRSVRRSNPPPAHPNGRTHAHSRGTIDQHAVTFNAVLSSCTPARRSVRQVAHPA